MSEDAIRILLVEDNPGDARLLQEMLADVGEHRTNMQHVEKLSAALDLLAIESFNVALLDLGLPDSSGIETFERLHEQYPDMPVVVLSGLDDESVAISAVERGAQDYIAKARLSGEMLLRAVRYAISRHEAQARAVSQVQSGHQSRVLAFIGAKGGVGTTTVALNIASALVHKRKSVVAVELRSYVGAFAEQLGADPVQTLDGLVELGPAGITPEALQPRLFTLASGLRVLFGPQDASGAVTIDPELTRAVVEVLATMFDYVVLDLPVAPSELSRLVLQDASRVALVTEPEPTSVRAGRAIVEMLHGWGITGQLAGAIVVNRVATPMGINMEEVRARLGCPILSVVPSAPEDCRKALHEGSPVVLTRPEAAVAMHLSKTADQLIADTVALTVQ